MAVDGMKRTDLANGVRVVTERIRGVRSVALGVWVGQGSAHDDPESMGSHHLLEHLVFKRTRRRSAREIALALESLGGSLDAFTGREHTSFQARVLDEHVPEALDVLADLVLFPLLRSRDLELEREVVLEEILTVRDTPDDLLFQSHGRALWNGHPYGQSILGTSATVPAIDASMLRSLHERGYRSGNLVVAGAGRIDHADVVHRVEELFATATAKHDRPEIERARAVRGKEIIVSKDTAQTHIVIGTDVPGRAHPSRYALVLLAGLSGAG